MSAVGAYLFVERRRAKVLEEVQIDIPGTRQGPGARIRRTGIVPHAGISRHRGVTLGQRPGHGPPRQVEPARREPPAPDGVQAAVPARGRQPDLDTDHVVGAGVRVGDGDVAEGEVLRGDGRVGEADRGVGVHGEALDERGVDLEGLGAEDSGCREGAGGTDGPHRGV
jgi:hypothetical protein